jgi:uncharacterized protein YjiS (DUF1127 family)
MNHPVFARRYGHAPDQTAESQIEPGAQGWSGSRTTQASSAYGRGSESSTMNSLRASVSRPGASLFCAATTELLRKPVPGGATMFDRNNSLPLSLFLQAERQARLDTLVIKACMRGIMSGLAEWLSALGRWATRLARNLAHERLLRSAIRELHQLDDRTLADIGITRCGIEYTVHHGRAPRLAISERAATIFGGCTCDGR